MSSGAWGTGVLICCAVLVASSPATAIAAGAKPPPKPVITSVVYQGFASSGTAGGATVTVKGRHFTGVKAVRFGDVRGSKVTVQSSTRLTVRTPRHPIGEVHVRVTSKAGTSAVAHHDAFDFQERRTIDGGDLHSCQILSSRTVRCWGDNAAGDLGDGNTTESDVPMRVSGLGNAVSIATGFSDSCALSGSGAVFCWGANGHGQLGNGSTEYSTTPARVEGLGARALSVTVGDGQACAVVVGNVARCWGYNGSGELGDGTTTDRHKPVTVHRLTAVVSVSAGPQFSCGVRRNGAAYCWGFDRYDQLGDGTRTSSTLPVRTLGIAGAVAVSAGGSTACALVGNGRIRCWGSGVQGELGNGTTADSSQSVPVTGITGASGVVVGGLHVCALVRGIESCWGYGYSGQLGTGSSGPGAQSDVPEAVGLTGVVAIGVGSYHSLAVVAGGVTEAWGANDHGQLGDGSTTDSDVPVTVG